ncbi:hypothetical protein F5Y15DRAFT_201388 [Xylariaceae sp. FL0016]|nr:hypothetical protein F5Y15DRAFT_201388 [Xylariaceae sp. FL0016]
MFPIDTAILPSLATRKALLVVDPQNDFLAEDGALPVKIPLDLPERIANFAVEFRQNGGEVIWVQSQFESPRSAASEQILTSDRHVAPVSSGPVRGRRPGRPLPPGAEISHCPEAFLTHAQKPQCVQPNTEGFDMHPVIKQTVAPGKDHVVIKSHYSAFKSEKLLRLLRIRFVTELFICGTSTNIGVMATAVDAASHGYTITIVDDCCGFQSIMRHRTAIRQIAETTGCEILTAAGVLSSMGPKSKASRRAQSSAVAASRHSTVRDRSGEGRHSALSSSTLLSSFEKLSLNGEPAADESEVSASAQDSSPPLQSLGDSCPAKIGDQTHRDPIAGTGNPTGLDNETKVDSGATMHDDEKTAPAPTIIPLREGQAVISVEANDTSSSDSPSDLLTSVPVRISESSNDSETLAAEETESISPLANTKEEDNKNTMARQDMIKCESDSLCEGDTKVFYNVLQPSLAESVFERVRDEVLWQRMSHQGGEVPRLVAVQGLIGPDGSMPTYRHPADESPPLLPFSSTVNEIRLAIEGTLGHPVNHCLIQFYRDGNDYISEHSDKTLDIVQGSYVANVSLGAERTMTFRTKRKPKTPERKDEQETPKPDSLKRRVERTKLPHNSLCRMGLVTNMRWLHSIRWDRRPECEKSAAELAYDGGRISLTFRQIGTFLNRDNSHIWGQGAQGKTKETAHSVINGQTPEAIDMLRAFGKENNSTEFDWGQYYGQGFDLLHMSTAPRLFLSSDPVVNMRIQVMLAEFDISYARGSMSPQFNWKDSKATKDPAAIPADLPIKYVDNDEAKSTLTGQLGIMLYLSAIHCPMCPSKGTSRAQVARTIERFHQGLGLLDKWRNLGENKSLGRELAVWETYAGLDRYIAGPTVTLADYAFWPLLHAIVSAIDTDFEYKNLMSYYERMKQRESVARVLGQASLSSARSSSPKNKTR